ncbi:UvrD-helicase domain-containing protein [Salegentibacter maritimus]|uniref:UvrD-helicase domain-containing protein n=1 Tax=Salegentibacter maritimus TaxID=2794347 RepID=UPI0018E426ED|nr:UvrD-helicase domain-containing protein [Salegentibacter maritimus]MBI6115964.1 UvrD-helicase domain-containing protein [Salegentibacter maritimus]
MYYIIGLFSLVIFYFIFKTIKKNKRKRAELRAFQESEKERLSKFIPTAVQFVKSTKEFLQRDEYLSNYQLFQHKEQVSSLAHTLNNTEYRILPDFQNETQIFDDFLKSFSGLSENVKAHNSVFVEKELKETQHYFSDIEGKSLDHQQRSAIIKNEDNNIVVAGAGSGKTTTIAGKVKYLIEKCNYKEDEILLISFTSKSAAEMHERIRNKMGLNIPVKTFHKLGLEIIAESRNEKPSILGFSQKRNLELIEELLSAAKKDSEYFHKLNEFLSIYLKPYREPESFKSESEYYDYLKEQKLYGYKEISFANGEGRFREKYKSQEEVLIANFLFRNQIAYKYEEPYQYKTASKKFGQYKPDFHLTDYNIYIEHFAMDEEGNVPSWFRGSQERSAQEIYTEGIKWKRNEHRMNGTKLVETYSYQQRNGVLLEELKKKLLQKGVKLNPMPDEEFWEFLKSNHPREISDLTQLIYTFLVLLKSNNQDLQTLKSNLTKNKDHRAVQFLEIFEPVYNLYENFLKSRREIDFSDMINLAIKAIKNGGFESPYKYIIIDEFQDISQSRYELVKSLLDIRPETKLFCVGDDWQSIYRFTGSDIGFFTEFESRFESTKIKGYNRKTEKGFIEKTYRFNQELIDLSSEFILKNPNQLRKNLISGNDNQEEVLSITSYYENMEAVSAVDKILKDILNKTEGLNTSILMLGRYNHDREIFKNSQLIIGRFDTNLNRYRLNLRDQPQVKIEFMTVHSAKGLEADHVIIINGKGGTYGFPSEVADDPLLSILLSSADQYPNGEERRLFYVALTRARKHVHLLKDLINPSKFVEEIDMVEQEDDRPICGWCATGRLDLKTGPYGNFYSCDNYGYCNYTISEENHRNKEQYAESYDSEISAVNNVI